MSSEKKGGRRKTIRLGMDFFGDETPLFAEVAVELQREKGIEVIGVSLGRRWERLLKKKGLKTVNMGSYLEEHWNEFSIDEDAIRRLESKYGSPWLSEVIHGDKYFVHLRRPGRYSYEHIQRMLVGYLRFWEDYFTENRVNAFFGSALQAMYDFTRHRVAVRHGAMDLTMSVLRIPEMRFSLSRDEADQPDAIKTSFEALMKRKLTADERSRAEKFLQDFREKTDIKVGLDIVWADISFRMPFVKEFFKRMKRWYIDGWGGGMDFMTPHPLWSAYQRGIRIVAKKTITRILRPFGKPVEGERYVFLPLHFYPEASTLYRARYYTNEVSLVENVAKSLPVTHRLYIKEHPSSIGTRHIGFYSALKKFPNVRLLTPGENTHSLIKGADAVVVLNGTIGLEAIYYERPVIMLGETFYSMSGVAKRLMDIHKLPETLREVMNGYKPDRERLLRFIIAMLDASYYGNPNCPHHDPRVMDRENILGIARGIRLELRK